MSKFTLCPDCKGRGYADRYRTKICPTCHGKGRSKKLQRGYHDGFNVVKRGRGATNYCICGHSKEGTGIDNDGNIRTYCTICHNIVTNETRRRRRENVA
jgi:DnaJ-class molecular chaperone